MASVTIKARPSPSATQPGPLIKGIFVNSHIEAVRRALGEAGVQELERRYGAPLQFRSAQDVPVRDEVRLIENALDILQPGVPAERRSYEAGRLHFRNFTTTPWAKILFTVFPRNYKFMLLHAKTIAERVFKGVQLDATQTGDHSVLVVMANADYPLDHFRGLFQEWMEFFGLRGRVEGIQAGPGIYEYHCRWAGDA